MTASARQSPQFAAASLVATASATPAHAPGDRAQARGPATSGRTAGVPTAGVRTSAAVGYASTAQFGAAFLRRIACTPLTYRTNARR